MKSRRAFTLVELLVVISIIALLIAMLLPALAKAHKLALRVVCSSNIRSLLQGVLIYASDQRNQFPPSYQGNYPIGGLGSYQANQQWGFALLYSEKILNDPAFMYCPDPAPALAPTSLNGAIGVGSIPGAPGYLPSLLASLENSSSIKSQSPTFSQNWRNELGDVGGVNYWYAVYSSYAYWYQRPNGIQTSWNYNAPFDERDDPVSQYGGWTNPITKVRSIHNYQDASGGLYAQTPTDPTGRILISDVVASQSGTWDIASPVWAPGFYSNHMGSNGVPSGANIGYNDGSVAWKQIGAMTPGYAYEVYGAKVNFYR